MLSKFDDVELEHVYLEENKEPNDLTQIATGYKLNEGNFESLITIKENLLEEFEVLTTLTSPDWQKTLVDYL